MKTKYNLTPAADAGSGGQTQYKSIHRQWSVVALGGFLFTTIFALSSQPVAGQCEQYDVSGQWTIRQGSFVIPIALTQNGKTVSGTAFHKSKTDSDEAHVSDKIGYVHGQITGTVDGGNFEVQINWSGGGAGVYRGKIERDGHLYGTTYDKNKPSSTARWSSNHSFNCAETAAVPPANPAPAPVVRPVKSSGKWPTPAPVVRPVKSSGRPKASAAVPTIKANPIVLTIPAGQSHGTITLTWDGGPDHPDAEVWMKAHTRGGEETLVVQQGKGTRSMTLQVGPNYAFMLKDAGEVLARTAVLTRQ